jgi:predicted glycosyl hydrolase (DUF1957 family)
MYAFMYFSCEFVQRILNNAENQGWYPLSLSPEIISGDERQGRIKLVLVPEVVEHILKIDIDSFAGLGGLSCPSRTYLPTLLYDSGIDHIQNHSSSLLGISYLFGTSGILQGSFRTQDKGTERRWRRRG